MSADPRPPPLRVSDLTREDYLVLRVMAALEAIYAHKPRPPGTRSAIKAVEAYNAVHGRRR